MMKKLLLTAVLAIMAGFLTAQDSTQVDLSGYIYSAEDRLPLSGAVARENVSGKTAIADADGRIEINSISRDAVLVISFIGFETVELTAASFLLLQDSTLFMENSGLEMEEVTVLSTGFQEIPKERATGSFVSVDRELVNRKVSTNLLDRLEDVTPGLVFNRGPGASTDPISIRGRSTLFAETRPLIIIDNFPYDGPLENINPNDVENITVLRDAASASIWGARSGNGVIVIRTKSGSFNNKLNVSLNASVNILQRPDLFARPRMSIADFVDMEQLLFDNGNYDSRINQSGRPPLTPGVEAMLAHRDGLISRQELDRQLAAYKGYDSRSQLTGYFYRPSVNQQYSLALSGGTELHRYNLALGTDLNRQQLPGNTDSRITLSAQNDWRLFDKRLEIGASLYLVRSVQETGTQLPDMAPYERLIDEGGNHLPVIRDFNTRYVSSLPGLGFLDGTYVPLDETGLVSDRGEQTDIRLNTSLGYRIRPWLSAKVLYQFWNNSREDRLHKRVESYDVRWLINRFTRFDETGAASYPVPLGGTLDQQVSKMQGSYLRGQLNIDRDWGSNHGLHAIAGAEMKDVSTVSTGSLFYGYDDEFGLSLPVDYLTRFAINPVSFSTISSGISHGGTIDRFVSLFANASYSFRERYVLTASARRDASNLFGVNTNMRSVPLWSTGVAWTASEEGFYRSGFIPYLKLRMTFGYNGNVDRTTSSLTTASYYITGSSSMQPGLRAASVQNPPNPDLRWERVKMWNAAVDFGLKNELLDGSVELYIKDGIDLIGDTPVAPSLGKTIFRGNFAATRTKGADLALHSAPFRKAFRWDINLFHSLVREEVTGYKIEPALDQMVSGLFAVPNEGKPLFALYSYQWAGLDPDTGDPLGVLEGEPSRNYLGIRRNSVPADLVYHGSARPTSFGALRNTFTYRGISLSVNISYRLGYYFRRNSVDYTDLLNGRITHRDYEKRWQAPGDETLTSVPSLPDPLRADANRQTVYELSEILVERGDHIRLQDIRLAYSLDRISHPWLPFAGAEVYSYVNNLGILWKKTAHDIDPDFQGIPPAKGFAFGLRITM